MPVVRNAGLRSDGELVQAVADTFHFRVPQERSFLLLPAVQIANPGDRHVPPYRFGIDVDVSVEDDDDDGLPDTIIWCIDGDGEGGRSVRIELDLANSSWSIEADGFGFF